MSEIVQPRRDTPSLLVLIVCLLVCFAAAALGSMLTLPQIPVWYEGLAKPSFSPPNWLFGPVWTVLYALMAIAMWRVYLRSRGPERRRAVTVFAVQLALNVAWSAAFFASHSPAAGLVVIAALILAILATILVFARIDRLAALLLLPYIAWVSFATILNAAVWALN